MGLRHTKRLPELPELPVAQPRSLPSACLRPLVLARLAFFCTRGWGGEFGGKSTGTHSRVLSVQIQRQMQVPGGSPTDGASPVAAPASFRAPWLLFPGAPCRFSTRWERSTTAFR